MVFDKFFMELCFLGFPSVSGSHTDCSIRTDSSVSYTSFSGSTFSLYKRQVGSFQNDFVIDTWDTFSQPFVSEFYVLPSLWHGEQETLLCICAR